jgi:hypothetical protein
MMRIIKLAVLAIVALFAALAVAPNALASNVHFKKGSPVFTDLGLALNASGKLTGLGNGDILVDLTAVGQATSTCTNPAGANQPPGQNPAEVVLSGTEAIPDSQIKNGNVSFSVTTSAPESPVAGAPGCPSSHWTQTITDVAFSSATITVYQNGSVVFQQTYSL